MNHHTVLIRVEENYLEKLGEWAKYFVPSTGSLELYDYDAEMDIFTYSVMLGDLRFVEESNGCIFNQEGDFIGLNLNLVEQYFNKKYNSGFCIKL